MDKSRYSTFYTLSKTYVRLSLTQFYRKWQVHKFRENVPKDVPIIFAPNHQNALIDALNTVGSTNKERQPTFMTRADVFVAWAKPFMDKCKMLPIYRQRDGGDVIAKNEAIFAECVVRLTHNESLIIFPEGNHGPKLRLRPLKKGAARIAFQAAEKAGFDLPLHVVPVGFNYDSQKNFRSDLLINYGPPIPLADFVDAYHQNPNRAYLLFTKAIQAGIESQMIHITEEKHYETIDGLRRIFSKDLVREQKGDEQDLHQRFVEEKSLIDRLQAEIKAEAPGVEKLHAETAEYLQGLKDLRIRDHVIAGGNYGLGGLLLQALGLLLGLPLHLYGVLNNYHLYRLCDYFAMKFKDEQFRSSIRHISGFALYPISYVLQTGIVWAFTNWWIALLYFISLPLSGNFAMWFSVQVKKWWSRWKVSRLSRKQDPRIKRLREIRANSWTHIQAVKPVISESAESGNILS